LEHFVHSQRVSFLLYATLLIGTMTPQTKGSVCSGASNKLKPELCTHKKKKKGRKTTAGFTANLTLPSWFFEHRHHRPLRVHTVKDHFYA